MLVLLDEVDTSHRTDGLKAMGNVSWRNESSWNLISGLVPTPFLTGRWNLKLPGMSEGLGPHG